MTTLKNLPTLVEKKNELKLPWILVIGLVLFSGAQNLVHIISAIIDPLQLDYSEGLVITGIYRITHNPSLAATYSFNPTFYNTTDLAYPPVFPYLAALLDRVLGMFTNFGDPSGAFTAMYAARFLTLAGLIWSAGLIYWFGRHFGAGKLAALTGAALFFCFHPTIYWGVYARVDSLALALVLTGLALVLKSNRSGASQYLLWLSLIPFTLSFFTKQSEIAVPAAVVIYFFLSRQWRKGLAYGIALAGLIALGLAALVLITNGNFLFFFTMERFTPYVPLKLVKTYGLFLLLYGPICFVAIMAAWKNWKKGGFDYRITSMWAGLAFLISLTIGKAGAADYYFFEIMAYASIQVALFLAKYPLTGVNPGNTGSFDQAKTQTKLGRWFGAIAIFQALVLLGLGIWLDYPSNDRDMVRQADGEAARLVEAAGPRGTPVFGEMSGPLVAAGRPEQFFDHFIYRQLVRAGQRDGQLLVNDFANKHFKLALFGYDILHYDVRPDVTEPSEWPAGLEQAIRANYRLVKDIRDSDGRPYVWVLAPRD